jgi:hypothetical protein
VIVCLPRSSGLPTVLNTALASVIMNSNTQRLLLPD